MSVVVCLLLYAVGGDTDLLLKGELGYEGEMEVAVRSGYESKL